MQDLSLLAPELREKVESIIQSVSFKLIVICTIREADEQARLFRRGRSLKKIQNKAEWIRKYNPKMADILLSVAPQHGKKIITKAGPGESWHQYGLAVDCAPYIDGCIPWSGAHAEWAEYGRACVDHGLVWGGNFSFRDLVHAQLPLTGNPLKGGYEIVTQR